MTFSLVAHCPETDMLGVVISSSSPAVAARCSHVRAGVGAVASQNITDPDLGTQILDLMGEGLKASEALQKIEMRTPFINYRQLLAVDKQGNSAIYSGEKTLGIWASVKTNHAASGGNLLDNTGVVDAMLEQFENFQGNFGDRLIASLRAGLKAGGESGDVHSAGIKIADKLGWPIVDLRCDWTEKCPIENIAHAWDIYKPQLDDYVRRAVNPESAPSYGVPGDE